MSAPTDSLSEVSAPLLDDAPLEESCHEKPQNPVTSCDGARTCFCRFRYLTYRVNVVPPSSGKASKWRFRNRLLSFARQMLCIA